jgi:hypothetical protein
MAKDNQVLNARIAIFNRQVPPCRKVLEYLRFRLHEGQI